LEQLLPFFLILDWDIREQKNQYKFNGLNMFSIS